MKEKSTKDCQKEIKELKKKIKHLENIEIKHKQTIQDLLENDEKYRIIVENSGTAVAIISYEGIFLFINTMGALYHGCDKPASLFGKTMWELFPKEVADIQMKNIRKTVDSRKPFREVTTILNNDIKFWFEVLILPLEQKLLKTPSAILITRDISAIKRKEEENTLLQDKLRNSQKLESIGHLAGGIAHDLNNLLTPILGYTEIGLMSLHHSDPLYEKISRIQTAGKRGKELTHRLLAFSRKQVLEMKIVNLSKLINKVKDIVYHTIREDIEIIFNLDQSLNSIKADAFQIEQILVNLAFNAQDAMQTKGKLIIETMNVNIDQEYTYQHPEFLPGKYVLCAISDNGCGMDKDILEKIFEPFFTTKEQTKGTGLGLSMVYGIIKQHNGYVYVYSEKGKGTTFKLYFPAVDEEAVTQSETKAENLSKHGTERILVVEDEEMVRNMLSEILEKHNYHVISAENTTDALSIAKKEKNNIDLLLTDVVMPKMNGKELFHEIKTIIPNISVLYMSGYTYNVIAQHGILDYGTNFLQKPFTISSLTEKVREVLDID